MPTKRPCDGLWGWRASRISWPIFVSLSAGDPHLNIVAAFRPRGHRRWSVARARAPRVGGDARTGQPWARNARRSSGFFDLETRVLRVVTSRAFLAVV